MSSTDPRYPIGKFAPQESYSREEVKKNIDRIESLPEKLKAAISGLDNAQLDTPYRDGGWTLRQVVHHLPDSHLNAYVRTKWTLTENNPIIKAYDEKAWANTPETAGPTELSVSLLQSLHTKWVVILKSLSPEQLQRTFTHPDTKKQVPLDRMIAMYAWHGEHHLAHVLSLKTKMGS
ncbi:bacillithiol transferase BstA [soil metagenome]